MVDVHAAMRLPDLHGKPFSSPANQRRHTESPKIVSGFRFPPGGLRMTTVSLPPSRRARKEPPCISEALNLSTKTIRWDEATHARPPLRIDLDGPGPQAYSQTGKPLNETNAPAYSFGKRCWPEKTGGGARTSWQKTWFHTKNVWCDKVDFHNDATWPAPTTYRISSFVEKSTDKPQPPSFSMGKKFPFSIVKKNAGKDPAPNIYSIDAAAQHTHRTSAAFSHQFRRNGTNLWSSAEQTPGPGSYNPRYKTSFKNCPAYSMMLSARKPTHEHGPFAAF